LKVFGENLILFNKKKVFSLSLVEVTFSDGGLGACPLKLFTTVKGYRVEPLPPIVASTTL
jgi:hypothetical protein